MSHQEEIRVGSLVLMQGSRTTFEVIEGPNKKNRYLIAHGAIRSWVDASSLSLAPGPRASKTPSRGTLKRNRSAPVKQGSKKRKGSSHQQIARCDLHGVNREQAAEMLLTFFDKALQNDTDVLEVVHGIGSGTIKAFALEFFSRQSQVKRIRPDEKNAGVTWIYL